MVLISFLLAPGLMTPAAAQEASPQALPEYTLVPGDSVDIIVFGESDLTRTVPIRPDGKISLPLVGDVHAASLTPTQLAARIADALRAYLRDPRVSVSVSVFQRGFVNLVGQVAHPGAIEIQRGWTVLEVMGAAGGVTARAALKKATLIRRATGQVVPLDLDRLLLKGDRSANVPVEPGDIIMVPMLQNRIMVLGLVRGPGAIDLDDGSRVMDALSAAGGPSEGAGLKHVGIIRIGTDGKPTVTQVDVNRILKEGDASQNLPVQNGDVVYVPRGPVVVWREVLSWLSGLSLIRALWPGLIP